MLGVINRLIVGRPREADAALLALTLNNMTQGVVLLDTSGRLIVCNDQYRAMYRLSPYTVKPGATLIDLIRNRIDSGSLQRDAQDYCDDIMRQITAGQTLSFINETPDGRVISVINRPIAGTIYWVGIHDDITERRMVEAAMPCSTSRKPGALVSKKPSHGSSRASKAFSPPFPIASRRCNRPQPCWQRRHARPPPTRWARCELRATRSAAPRSPRRRPTNC
jgi:PAS fold